jgi:hypothetical protein
MDMNQIQGKYNIVITKQLRPSWNRYLNKYLLLLPEGEGWDEGDITSDFILLSPTCSSRRWRKINLQLIVFWYLENWYRYQCFLESNQ